MFAPQIHFANNLRFDKEGLSVSDSSLGRGNKFPIAIPHTYAVVLASIISPRNRQFHHP